MFRPCIVAGPRATMLIEQTVGAVPRSAIRCRYCARGSKGCRWLTAVLPDPGVPLQLVHHDDVARAMAAAIGGDGPAGVYNLAGEGRSASRDIARRSAGARSRSRARGQRSAPPRPGSSRFVSSKLEWADRPADPGPDGHRQSPPRPRLEAAARRRRDAARNRRRRPRRRACSTKHRGIRRRSSARLARPLQLDPLALADVVAVDLQGEGPHRAVLVGRDRSRPSPRRRRRSAATCLWRAAGFVSLKRRLIRVGMSRWVARFSTAIERVPSSIAIPSQTRIGRLAK